MVELNSVVVNQGQFQLGPLDILFCSRITGIIGPNGSGKSTLCRVAAGIVQPDRGVVNIDGRPLASLSSVQRAAALSFVSQELPAGEGFSLLEFVSMGFYRFSRDFIHSGRGSAVEALQTVDLADRADQQYRSLSGGEKRRAVLARALVQDAQTLILDEPASFLDYAHSRVMAAVLRRFVEKQNGRVIVVSHDCDFLRILCDEIIGLQDGMLMRQGSAVELLESIEFLTEIYGIDFKRIGGRLLPDFNY